MVFPGQGTQVSGMGAPWQDHPAWKVLDEAERALGEHPGRMAALLGATLEQAVDACAAAPDACWIANDNAPGQVVIAGTPEGVELATARAKELGVRRATALNVGGAFHTPLMAS